MNLGQLSSKTNTMSADELYKEGLKYEKRGNDKDYANAAAYYKLAAQQGVAEAHLRLGIMYENGRGVEQDYSMAEHHYTGAAERGLVDAHFRLGIMYENGRGVQQDYSMAEHHYKYAAERGHLTAPSALDTLRKTKLTECSDSIPCNSGPKSTIPLLPLESESESELESEDGVFGLVPPNGTPSQSQTFSRHQTPSPARLHNSQQTYTFLDNQLTQFLLGVEANMLSKIRQNVRKTPSEEQLRKFLSTDVARENIFEQFKKIDDPARRRALQYSYEVYSFAAAHCGILHDKLSARLAKILTDRIFSRYSSFVQTLNGISHSNGGIKCDNVDSVSLITELKNAFSSQFTNCTGNTVGQPRCHAAVEAITNKYCDWLKRHGITLAASVPVFMTDRQKAKLLLTEIQRNSRNKTKINVDNRSDGERQFVEALYDAVSLADATVSFCNDRFGWIGGVPKMDGAPTDSVGARYFGSESMKTQSPATFNSKKKPKKDTIELYSFVKEPPSPKAQLDVDFTVWDRDASTLYVNRNTVRPLSHGILYTYCIEYFDIKQIGPDFVKFFESNHNKDCFKPLTLMYMPTQMLNEMLGVKSEEYKNLHKLQLDSFIQSRCQEAKNAMQNSNKVNLYVPPTVHYEGTVNEMPVTLVWVSCGSISNNDSLTIVERVVHGIYNLSVRGGISMNCSKARLNNVCCYLGQTVDDNRLIKTNGDPTGIGEVVVVLGNFVKEDGDWSKADAVDKSQCVLRDNHIECKSLITTVDKIAAKNVASFAYDIPACLFGQSCTLYIPACLQQISLEARREIASLQVKIEQLELIYRTQFHEGVHAVFEKNIGAIAKKYAKAIDETSSDLESKLESTLDENPHKKLPSILTALEIADIFERPGGWLVPVKKFDDLVNKPLSSEVHFGARNPDSFVSLFMEQERNTKLVEALGGLDLVINPDNWVTPKRNCTERPHSDSSLRDMLIHKLENLPECDIQHTKDFAFKICEEIFKSVKHVFILLDHYDEFANDNAFFNTRFGLSRDAGNSIKVKFDELRHRVLDPTIISLLKAHIDSTTTPGSTFRIRCENAVKKLFPSYDIVKKVENYDSASMLESAEKDAVSQPRLLECHRSNDVSVDPPSDRRLPPNKQFEMKPGGSRKKNKHNTTKKYKTMSRKSRQTRRNKYKHIRTIRRRKNRRNNRN